MMLWRGFSKCSYMILRQIPTREKVISVTETIPTMGYQHLNSTHSLLKQADAKLMHWGRTIQTITHQLKLNWVRCNQKSSWKWWRTIHLSRIINCSSNIPRHKSSLWNYRTTVTARIWWSMSCLKHLLDLSAHSERNITLKKTPSTRVRLSI